MLAVVLLRPESRVVAETLWCGGEVMLFTVEYRVGETVEVNKVEEELVREDVIAVEGVVNVDVVYTAVVTVMVVGEVLTTPSPIRGSQPTLMSLKNQQRFCSLCSEISVRLMEIWPGKCQKNLITEDCPFKAWIAKASMLEV